MVATTESAQPKTIHAAFGSLHDIRQQGKVQHPLIKLKTVSIGCLSQF